MRHILLAFVGVLLLAATGGCTAGTHLYSSSGAPAASPTPTSRLSLANLARDDASGMPIVANTSGIQGYADRISVAPGETIGFKVSTPRDSFSIEIARYGHEPAVDVLHRDSGIPGKLQSFSLNAFRAGAGWETSYAFTIPPEWRSGMYAARLFDASGREFYATFVVTAAGGADRPRLVVLANTNTWEAYNAWGGASFYADFPAERLPADPELVPLFAPGFVNYARPNPMAFPIGHEGHLAQAELHVLRWLERNGWNYDLISDWDLHYNPHVLRPYDVLLLHTHPEYWSAEMYDALERHLERGGHLVYIDGNAIDLKVVFDGDMLEMHSDGSNHLNGEPGGYWRNLGRPQAAVLGLAYDSRGYDTYAPFEVLASDHWVFEGTGLRNGDLVGTTGLNRGGGSGWETDKRTEATPPGTELLARGTNPGGGGAEMIFYWHPGGGGVFSAGSITFGGSLAVDEHLSTIVNNVLRRFLAE